MADVDMADAGPAAAPATPAKSKATVKSSKSGATEGGADGKKRFEVKKVYKPLSQALSSLLTI